MRFAPPYDSHDFADATSRAGFSAPRARASSPTTNARLPASHGSAVLPAREIDLARRGRGTTAAACAPRPRPGSPAAESSCSVDRAALVAAVVSTQRERAVGGAEIDADDEAVRHASAGQATSTSAGATTVRPVAGSGGRSSRATSQPRWRRTPRNGGAPATLPTTLMRAGSMPRSTVTVLPSSASRTGSRLAYLSSASRQPRGRRGRRRRPAHPGTASGPPSGNRPAGRRAAGGPASAPRDRSSRPAPVAGSRRAGSGAADGRKVGEDVVGNPAVKNQGEERAEGVLPALAVGDHP